MAVSIDLGLRDNGQPALLDLEELLATRLLVQGNSGSGKSHLLRRLLERSAPCVQQAVIDPEGDFISLADRFGHLVIDAAEQTEQGLVLAGERVRQHRVSVVLNLEGLDVEGQMRRAAAFLDGMFDGGTRLLVPDAGGGRRGAALRPRRSPARWRTRRAPLARRHDRPDVPRPQARPGRHHRHPAPGQAGQERRGRGVQFPDGPHLPRHRHGPRRRPAGHGEAPGGDVPRPASAGTSWRSARRWPGGRWRCGSARSKPKAAAPAPGLMPMPETPREEAHALILKAAPAEAPRPRRVPAAAAARPAGPARRQPARPRARRPAAALGRGGIRPPPCPTGRAARHHGGAAGRLPAARWRCTRTTSCAAGSRCCRAARWTCRLSAGC